MEVQELYTYMREKLPNICQISVIREGKEVYCKEFNGYKRTDSVHIASATKSVMALLIGIAIDHKMIGGVDDKVISYFPKYSIKRGEKTIFDVTIGHLLTMRAPYKGQGDPWTKVCESKNWVETSLDYLGGRGGISNEFNYKTVCLHILSGILFKASGMKTVDFANEYLFRPLGIGDYESFYAKNEKSHKQFIMDKDPKKNVWLSDPIGIATPGYGLCMSAKDMAKIGQLCIQNGVWNKKQIVSPEWLSEMLFPRIIKEGSFSGKSYGFLWWIIHPEKNIYAAIGDSGNVIYVNPIQQTVVAISAYFRPSSRDSIDFLENTLLPVIQTMMCKNIE